MNKRKYRDRKWLYEQYVEKNLTQSEIAEKVSVGQGTISDWVRRFDLKKRRNDEEFLKEKYIEDGMSSREIADDLGCDKKTILNNLHELGIKVKLSNEQKPPSYSVNSQGYQEWQHTVDGELKSVLEHRLLAVAKYGYDEVVNSVVHHRDHLTWHNQRSNLKLFDSQSEHMKFHQQK